MSSSDVPGPLSGVRVADLSRVLAGPYCTMLLADLGADVVKVERPGEGDETRSWGPPFAAGESAYFLAVNRRKRSLALDLGSDEGRELALELCDRADVVVENFKAGGAERLGVGYEDVRARNADVVYCSIRGLGDRPGYDVIAQAESGLMHVTGPAGGEPHKVGVAVVDVLAGLNAAVAILAALTGGGGRRVEVSLLDAARSALVNVAQGALITGQEATRHGNHHPSIVPYGPFHARDGLVVIAAANDGLFARLADAVGRPELADDPRFVRNPDRVANRDELTALLEAALAADDVAGWLERLGPAGVPAGRVAGVKESLDAAETLHADHAAAGPIELVRPAFRLDETEVPVPVVAPPVLGADTDAVLAELGCDADRIAALRGRGVAG